MFSSYFFKLTLLAKFSKKESSVLLIHAYLYE